MHQGTEKHEILESAAAAFYQSTGISAQVATEEQRSPERQLNAEIVFNFPGGSAKYSAEIQPHLSRLNLGTVLLRHTDLKKAFVLVTDFVNGVLAEDLRKQDIYFLDTAGNAFIRNKQSFVFVKGCRLDTLAKKERSPRIFKRAGLQVIYALLTNPHAESATYRKLAKIAKVATGSVGGIYYDLKNLGYVVETGLARRRLRKRKELFEKWIFAYPGHLRPTLSRGRFRTIDRKPIEEFKSTALDPVHGKWGGEVAAEHLAGNIRPATAIIYTSQNLTTVIQQLRLVTDREGPIEVLKPFWESPAELSEKIIVHPLLVYADLVVSGDGRNLEAAKSIYEKYLKDLIETD